MGIPPELQERVFELFYQADTNIDRGLGGMGVGLSLVRTIAKLQGGAFRYKARGEEKGANSASSFRWLPRLSRVLRRQTN